MFGDDDKTPRPVYERNGNVSGGPFYRVHDQYGRLGSVWRDGKRWFGSVQYGSKNGPHPSRDAAGAWLVSVQRGDYEKVSYDVDHYASGDLPALSIGVKVRGEHKGSVTVYVNPDNGEITAHVVNDNSQHVINGKGDVRHYSF